MPTHEVDASLVVKKSQVKKVNPLERDTHIVLPAEQAPSTTIPLVKNRNASKEDILSSTYNLLDKKKTGDKYITQSRKASIERKKLT